MGLLERSSPFERCSHWSPGRCDARLCQAVAWYRNSSGKVVPTASYCNICWRPLLQVHIGSVLEYDNAGHSRLWRLHRCATILALPYGLDRVLLQADQHAVLQRTPCTQPQFVLCSPEHCRDNLGDVLHVSVRCPVGLHHRQLHSDRHQASICTAPWPS